jgi:hypothetical protein
MEYQETLNINIAANFVSFPTNLYTPSFHTQNNGSSHPKTAVNLNFREARYQFGLHKIGSWF